MNDTPAPKDKPDRKAQALRANLRRRKEQERAREADPQASTLAYRPEPVGTIEL